MLRYNGGGGGGEGGGGVGWRGHQKVCSIEFPSKLCQPLFDFIFETKGGAGDCFYLFCFL